MKKMIYNRLVWGVIALGCLTVSCDNFLDVNTDDMMNEKDSYSQVGEVYSGFIGLAANFQAVADQYILVSELMGDLLEPTANASVEFWDIYRYEATNGNAEVNPNKFYNVITNCNDFFMHARRFHENNPTAIPDNVYLGMMSSAITYRTWAYLNIGKFYGEALYFDVPITDGIDMSKFPVLKLDDLVPELIDYMENGVDSINAFNALDWTKILNNKDYSWNRMSVNPNALITELHLWAGNYQRALEEGIKAVTCQGVIGNTAGSTTKFTLSDVYANAKWKELFSKSYTSADNEAFTVVPFDFQNDQTNRLQYYFSNTPPNVYYFRPHQNLITKYENQRQTSGMIGEDVHRGHNVTYAEEGGMPVVYRYTAGRQNHSKDAHIFIYRAADVFLMMAEALNGMGNVEAADSLLSVGLKKSWDGTNSVFLHPFEDPIWNVQGNLRECMGVRGRVGLAQENVRSYADETASLQRKQFVMDSLIAEETALEAAYEGKRWFTLLRMAKHSNNPAFLADQVCKKFSEGEREKYRTYLMDPRNWFIKYDQYNVK